MQLFTKKVVMALVMVVMCGQSVRAASAATIIRVQNTPEARLGQLEKSIKCVQEYIQSYQAGRVPGSSVPTLDKKFADEIAKAHQTQLNRLVKEQRQLRAIVPTSPAAR